MDSHVSEREWVLVAVSTAAAPSATRVAVWRKLKSLGAVYLQQSTVLLPETPTTRRAVAALADRVTRDGGTAQVLSIRVTDREQEQRLVDQHLADRDAEYLEVLERLPAFFEELEQEAGRGRVTYEELEESEADLARYTGWLGKIAARDYFGSSVGERARLELARAEAALTAFADQALTRHERGAGPGAG